MNKNSHIIDNTAEWRIKQILRENTISQNQFKDLVRYASSDKPAFELSKRRPMGYYFQGIIDYTIQAGAACMDAVYGWYKKQRSVHEE